MDYISDILTKSYTNQGIQNFSVYYDSLFFNLKVKDNSDYYNIVLIEKISFDYDQNVIKKTDNGIYINFGNTSNSQAFKTNGNCFVQSFYEPKEKKVFLVGVKQTTSSSTVPVLYCYDINQHSVEQIFPDSNILQEFESFDNKSFSSNFFPLASYIDNQIYLMFKSSDSNFDYLNYLRISPKNKSAEIKQYEIFKYIKNTPINVKSIDEGNLFLSYGSYLGVSVRV